MLNLYTANIIKRELANYPFFHVVKNEENMAAFFGEWKNHTVTLSLVTRIENNRFFSKYDYTVDGKRMSSTQFHQFLIDNE